MIGGLERRDKAMVGIRTLIPDNFLKICEIGGICGLNFGIQVRCESLAY